MKSKIMRKILTLFTLGIIICNVPIAQALPIQQTQELKTVCPNYPEVITLKILDSHTAICRIADLNALGEKSDIIELYRKTESGETDFSASLFIYSYGIRLVTLREHKYKSCTKNCSEMAQFWIVGRKFREWVPGYAKPNILSKYRNYVTIMLDTYEKNPIEKPEF